MNYVQITKDTEKEITRRIKARFSKKHINQLYKEVLAVQYEGKPRYTPTRRFTEDACLKSFWITTIERDGDWLVYTVNRRWDTRDLPIKIKFKQTFDDQKDNKIYYRQEPYSGTVYIKDLGHEIDQIIKWHCIAVDYWFKDATAIPIFL